MPGIRPGEKIHEILVSEEEAPRTFHRGERNLVILPLLPELRSEQVEAEPFGDREYSSADDPLDREAVARAAPREPLDAGRLRPYFAA